MFQDEWADELSVQEVGSVPWHGWEAPDEEAALKEPVERNPEEENVTEELHEVEAGVHHPVGQPLCVVIFVRTFDGFDATIRWVNEPNKVAEELSSIAHHQVQANQGNATQCDVEPLYSRFGFNLRQDIIDFVLLVQSFLQFAFKGIDMLHYGGHVDDFS